MGGHLPGEKVTPEIAALRGRKPGEDIQSPSKWPQLNTKEDLREMVSMLRAKSDGRPVGIKISAGHIERDLEYCVFAEPDFITIDGRGGATGSSPFFLREATTVPTIYALSRARKYLDSVHSDISLVITGGLRVSSDFAKAIAMGADAVAVRFCSYDRSRMSAVPDLRQRKLSGWHRHSGSKASQQNEYRSFRTARRQLSERFAERAQDVRPHHGARKSARSFAAGSGDD